LVRSYISERPFLRVRTPALRNFDRLVWVETVWKRLNRNRQNDGIWKADRVSGLPRIWGFLDRYLRFGSDFGSQCSKEGA
jgi:hypothetical protein